MKKLLIVLFFILPSLGFAQNVAGTINYEFHSDWLKRIEKSKFMGNEEKQRALQTWKNEENDKSKMQLTFNNKGSYYAAPAGELENRWQKDDYWASRNFENNTVLEAQLVGGKVYIVEDNMYSYSWKIKTEIKEVAGYLCILATTYDSLRNYNIDAWFTTDIPASIGPEDFMGLPGAILEVIIDEGVATISATSVVINTSQELPKLPKKIKGKRYTRAEYLVAVDKLIKDAEAARQMYWGLRY